jgi:hypothetical protein
MNVLVVFVIFLLLFVLIWPSRRSGRDKTDVREVSGLQKDGDVEGQ